MIITLDKDSVFIAVDGKSTAILSNVSRTLLRFTSHTTNYPSALIQPCNPRKGLVPLTKHFLLVIENNSNTFTSGVMLATGNYLPTPVSEIKFLGCLK